MEFGDHGACKHWSDLVVRSSCMHCVVSRFNKGVIRLHAHAVLTCPSSCSVVCKEKQKLVGRGWGWPSGAGTGERVCTGGALWTRVVCTNAVSSARVELSVSRLWEFPCTCNSRKLDTSGKNGNGKFLASFPLGIEEEAHSFR